MFYLVSAEEYQTKAEEQERLDVYLEFLTRIENDWLQILTGTRITLLETASTSANANREALFPEANAQNGTDLAVLSTTSKRSQYKQQMAQKNQASDVIMGAANPAVTLKAQLEKERKSTVPPQLPASPAESLRGQLRELRQIKDRVLSEAEASIVVAESQRLRTEMSKVDSVMEHLKQELPLYTNVYNGETTLHRPHPRKRTY